MEVSDWKTTTRYLRIAGRAPHLTTTRQRQELARLLE